MKRQQVHDPALSGDISVILPRLDMTRIEIGINLLFSFYIIATLVNKVTYLLQLYNGYTPHPIKSLAGII